MKANHKQCPNNSVSTIKVPPKQTISNMPIKLQPFAATTVTSCPDETKRHIIPNNITQLPATDSGKGRWK